jgi:hypothetical protein
MGSEGKRRVWYGAGDRGNVAIFGSDPRREQHFIRAVFACRSVADVRCLDVEDPGCLGPAIEAIEEDGLADDDLWTVEENMPGYGDGDWPPSDDLGMAEMFKDEQVSILIERCGAHVSDPMGGRGESLYIPDAHIDRVGALLAEWGYDVVRLD